MKIDYQVHTTASDGKFSPKECVAMAKKNGIESIAITDHDTVGGIEEAVLAGQEFGVEIISGIEMSCEKGDWGIHMLGFGIDPQNALLQVQLGEFRLGREARAERAVLKLQELGFHVDFADVRKRAAGVIARPHIADEIMEHPANAEKLAREKITTRKDLFDAYLADEAKTPVFASHTRLTIERAINLIHNAGGVAVWSHPLVSIADFKLVGEALQQFILWGLDGIEVIGNFTEDDTEFLEGLAAKYKLLRSVGSDFHDTFVDPEKLEEGAAAIGGYKTYGYPIEGIRESVLATIKKRRTEVAPQVSF